LTDALNQVEIATGLEEPFSTETVILLGANRNGVESAREAMEKMGVNGNRINTFVWPHEGVRWGTYVEADDLLLLGRIALFEDPAQGRAYLEAPPWEIFRLTPQEPQPIEVLEAAERRFRGSGRNEATWKPALDALDRAIRSRHADRVVGKHQEVGRESN
jgi:hypothetical protein